VKNYRPISFRNIDHRLDGYKTTNLTIKEWTQITDYIQALEAWISTTEYCLEHGQPVVDYDAFMRKLRQRNDGGAA
jgi:hypothetical protein